MARKRRPRRGSLAFHPRCRAKDHAGRVRSWAVQDKPSLLGFPGYKAGMTHVHLIEDWPTAPEKGREVVKGATVIDCPPLKVFGLRIYRSSRNGKYAKTEVWAGNFEKDLGRRVKRLPKEVDPERRLEEMAKEIASAADLTVLVHTTPRATGMKKVPDVMEIGLGGRSIQEKFDYGRRLLGKDIRIADVFKAGELVDVTAVTKGKGFQGPVKRFGIRIRSRKTNDARRNPGTLGPWHPHQIMWTVPLAGQMGYHQRTEHNKRLLKIGSSDSQITPKGGFLRYGEVGGDYVLVMGSTPGTTKRLVNLRKPNRPWKGVPEEPPRITSVSLSSLQGK